MSTLAACASILSIPVSRMRLIAFGKAPTPGRMMPSADRISALSDVSTAIAPTRSAAFSTERRLPIP